MRVPRSVYAANAIVLAWASSAALAAAAAADISASPIAGYAANPTLLKQQVDDQAVRKIVDRIVADGYSRTYSYILVDGPWAESKRTETGSLALNRTLFPDLRETAAYVHARGLKLGVRITVDPDTSYPGSRGHEARDVLQLLDWNIHLLLLQGEESPALLDFCKALREAVQAAKGDMVLSLASGGASNPWLWPEQVVEAARTTAATEATWLSLQQVLDNSVGLSHFAGPGHWNDLGLLQVGRGWLLEPEQRAMFGLWAALKSPLFMAADLRYVPPASRQILQNADVVAVQQDPLHVAADRIWKRGPLEVFAGPLSGGDRVVALFNRHTIGVQYPISNITVTWAQLGYPPEAQARVRNLWSGASVVVRDGAYTGAVELHDLHLVRISPLQPKPEYDTWRPWRSDSSS